MASQEQFNFFSREGYLVVPELLSPKELDQCKSEIDRLHKLAAVLDSRCELPDSSFQLEPFAPVDHSQDVPILRKIEDTGTHSDVFYKLARKTSILAIVKALLQSPDLLLFRSTLMLKPAIHGSSHALHQDSAYWPIDPPFLVTVSIALTKATLVNGCFKVLPRSHESGLQQWGDIIRHDQKLIDCNDTDVSKQKDVPLTAGSAIFFHSLLVHGSGPNKSPEPRHTALYTYFPAKVHSRTIGDTVTNNHTYPVVAGLNGAENHTIPIAPT